MRNKLWAKTLKHAAAPERVRLYLEQLAPLFPGLERPRPEQARILASLFSGSPASGELLLAHPAWLEDLLEETALRQPLRGDALKREVGRLVARHLPGQDYAAAFREIRLFKQRRLLRIAARDLARLAEVEVLIHEISDLADACLAAVAQLCWRQLSQRLGQPWHRDAEDNWQPTPWCILGLGKLGGQELNYSSDVDVIFVYAEEGTVLKEPPRKKTTASGGLPNHQFFTRLAESFILETGRATEEGQLYRIDLRLRPEGKAGPLARSLPSYENYYAQWGQTWERMMLIKARAVAGDEGLAHEFAEMIQPFRYPRMLGEKFLQEITVMKQRLEEEVVRTGEVDRNVKLGRGGIREIEFIVQTRQILHGGRNPFLQNRQTLPALQALVKYQLLPAAEAKALDAAYRFLRNVEHRLQMENNQQTHTLPEDQPSRQRLAALLGFDKSADFDRCLRDHCRNVRAIYNRLLQPAAESDRALPAQFEGQERLWEQMLSACGFREPQKALKLVSEFARGPGFVHVSARTEELGRQLIRQFLDLCPRKDATGRITNLQANTLSDPDRVMARLDNFVTAYGSRAMLYETWNRHPSLFELLVLLFDRSEFLAERAIRTPDLVDDLVLSGHLRRRKDAAQTLQDLRHGLADKDQKQWLRRYHQAEFMRIGLREIVGLADYEQNLAELSGLAEACLQYALESVVRRHRLKTPPFCIIGLGKLGGGELTYGSDLDIIFVAAPKERQLSRLLPLASEIMDLLSAKTEDGSVFETDARLRPDGEKGLLVNTLPAYEDYYRQRAMLWEIQALTRARFIAGDPVLGAEFIKLATRLTNFQSPSLPLAAFTPAWKQEIHRMRMRIEKERTPAGQAALAIKTGAGGLMDAEFIAQSLCLEHGLYEPNTLAALLAARSQGLLEAKGADLLIANYRQLRRVEIILRRWSYEGESELPAEPAPFYRVAVRCGFSTPEEFRQAVEAWRRSIRAVYAGIFAAEETEKTS